MLDRLSVRNRLILTFSTLTLLTAIIAVTAYANLALINSSATQIISVNQPKSEEIASLLESYSQIRVNVHNILILVDSTRMRKEYDEGKSHEKKFLVALDAIDKILDKDDSAGESESAYVSTLRRQFGKATVAVDKVMDLALKMEIDGATAALINDALPKMDELAKTLKSYLIQIRLADREASELIQKAVSGTQTVTGILALAALGIAAVFSALISRSITRPLGEAVRVARTVADGDLGSRIEVRSRDEVGQLMQALRDMNASLVRTVSGVQSATESITTAA